MKNDDTASSRNPFYAVRSRSALLFLVPYLFVTVFAAILLRRYLSPAVLLTLCGLLYPVLVAWIVFVIKRYHVSLRTVIGPLPRGMTWWWSASVLPLFLFKFSYLVLSVAAYPAVPVAENLAKSNGDLFFILSPGVMTWNCCVVILAAPVVEELVFRGILLNRLICKWGTRSAILATSVLFAALHVNKAGVFVFALLLALLYLKTRSLLIPMLCHLLYNLVACAWIYLIANSRAARMELFILGDWPWLWLGLLVAGYLLTCAIIFGLWRATVSKILLQEETMLQKHGAVEFNY